MIRINDHLINLHIIRHIWIETDGQRYVVLIDIEGQDGWITVPVLNRHMAESMLDTIQKEIETLYTLDDDGEEDYV